MPLIGSIDSLRARDITCALLAGINRHHANVVIHDDRPADRAEVRAVQGEVNVRTEQAPSTLDIGGA